MAVPYVFANATSAIPLSNLDNNFSTPVTIGNVAIQLGNTATTLGNVTMANVTITSVSSPITVTQGGTGNSSAFTANAVIYAPTTSTLATGSGLVFDGTNLGVGTSTPSSYSSQLVINAGSANAAVNIQTNSFAGTYSAALNFGTGGQGAGNQVPYYTQAQIKAVGTNDYSAAIVFSSQGSGTSNPLSERMRIDSSGNLLVNSTSALSQGKVGINFNGGTSQGLVLRTSLGSSGSTFIQFENSSGSVQGYITATTTTTTSFVGTSDQRLKENIVDAPSFLETINQLQVRQFTWKENGDTDIGFIAQELHTKLPKAVAVGIDNEDSSIQRPWGVDKSAIVPYLVKAVQELSVLVTTQSATITSLTERITALENK